MEPIGADTAPAAAVRAPAEDTAPAAAVEPTGIDFAHLARMTFGEASLEAEVLRLFEQQAVVLLDRMRDASPAAAAFAHTLKGSARGIGAWEVAAAAEAVETSAERASTSARAVARLAAAVEAARASIVQRLRGHAGDEE
jgi:HPt (histidine-containing phosphotransfer) domain-containing protein